MSIENCFKGKRVLVTGAGQGIGKQVAVRLNSYGAEVYAIGKTVGNLQELESECPGIKTFCVDLSNWTETREIIEKLPCFHAVVNNAGRNIVHDILDVQPEDFDSIMNLNLKAVMNISQITAKQMIQQGEGGSIVNVSSMLSRRALSGTSSYCVSKAGLDMLTKCMALELGKHNIRVNSVNPGFLMTSLLKNSMESRAHQGIPEPKELHLKDRTVLGDSLLPVENVVNTILYVLSELAGSMTAESVFIDGGFSAT